MWRSWGTPLNFFLGFTDELQKQIIINKTVEMGQQKTKYLQYFNIYNVALKKKKRKRKTPVDIISNRDGMICSSWDIEQNIGNFKSFFALLPFTFYFISHHKILLPWK